MARSKSLDISVSFYERTGKNFSIIHRVPNPQSKELKHTEMRIYEIPIPSVIMILLFRVVLRKL